MVHVRLWLWIKMPKTKIEEYTSLSEYEHQNQQKILHIKWFCLWVCVQWSGVTNLSVSKVRNFLFSKAPYKKFTLATRKFKRMEAFSRFKNEIWCIGLAYVDKIAKTSNDVRFLLVLWGLFDITVGAKEMKTIDTKETYIALLTLITKKYRLKKIGGQPGTRNCWIV